MSGIQGLKGGRQVHLCHFPYLQLDFFVRLAALLIWCWFSIGGALFCSGCVGFSKYDLVLLAK